MSFSNPNTPAARVDAIVLELRGDTGLVLRMAGAQPPLSREFALGVEALVRQCLRHEPPLPIELEQAIELTEEAVMPLAPQFARGPTLILRGLGATLIARSLEASGITKTTLALEEVESLFNRLVAVSLGRPESQETLPVDARFFAALLMLREFMHHLNFAQVTLHI